MLSNSTKDPPLLESLGASKLKRKAGSQRALPDLGPRAPEENRQSHNPTGLRYAHTADVPLVAGTSLAGVPVSLKK